MTANGSGALMWSARRLYDVDDDDDPETFLASSVAATSSKGGGAGWRNSPGALGLSAGKLRAHHSRTSSYQSYFSPFGDHEGGGRPLATEIFVDNRSFSRDEHRFPRSKSPQDGTTFGKHYSTTTVDDDAEVLRFIPALSKPTATAPPPIRYSTFNSTGSGSILSPSTIMAAATGVSFSTADKNMPSYKVGSQQYGSNSAPLLAPPTISRQHQVRTMSEADESSPTLFFRSGGAGGVQLSNSHKSGSHVNINLHPPNRHIAAKSSSIASVPNMSSPDAAPSSSAVSYGSPTLLNGTTVVRINHTRFESHSASMVPSPSSPCKPLKQAASALPPPPNFNDLAASPDGDPSTIRGLSDTAVNVQHQLHSVEVSDTDSDGDHHEEDGRVVAPSCDNLTTATESLTSPPTALNALPEESTPVYQYPTFLFGNGKSAEPTTHDVKLILKQHKHYKKQVKEDLKKKEEEEIELRRAEKKRKKKELANHRRNSIMSSPPTSEFGNEEHVFAARRRQDRSAPLDTMSNGQTRTDSANNLVSSTRRSSTSST
eukprot:GILJ01022078.1.p1 GENE.GILJ01022078.1~~GILJ01022078.1.p1  ORF type:complete len:557 (-),score=78.19 GILJ01022078.1:197-1825(-)